MVLEDLIPVRLAEEKPLNMLPIAFLYSTLAIFLSLWIFPANAAIVAVFLITIACIPLMLNVIGFEKQKSESSKTYLRDLIFSFIKNGSQNPFGGKVIPFFIFLFLGLSLAITFWYVLLPQDMLVNLFYLQLNTIKEINLNLSGSAVQIFSQSYFMRILINNVKVLAFSILFSFIYGAGAVFVIAWNASVIGVAMGDGIRKAISQVAGTSGLVAVAGYSSAISTGLLRYLIHGVPEILAYFVGALAGSLISLAVVRHEYNSEKFKQTVMHSMGLFGLAILILLIAAVIETTISPLIRL